MNKWTKIDMVVCKFVSCRYGFSFNEFVCVAFVTVFSFHIIFIFSYVYCFLHIVFSITIKPQRLITSFKTKLHNNQNWSRFSSGLKHKLRLKTPPVQFNQINLFLSDLVMVEYFVQSFRFASLSTHTLLRSTPLSIILFFISCKILTGPIQFSHFYFSTFFFQFGLK